MRSAPEVSDPLKWTPVAVETSSAKSPFPVVGAPSGLSSTSSATRAGGEHGELRQERRRGRTSLHPSRSWRCRCSSPSRYAASSRATSMSWSEANFGWPGAWSSGSASGTWAARKTLIPPTASTALPIEPRISGSGVSSAFCMPMTAEAAWESPAARSRGRHGQEGLGLGGDDRGDGGRLEGRRRHRRERARLRRPRQSGDERGLARGSAFRVPLREPAVRFAVTSPVPAPAAASSPSLPPGAPGLSYASEPGGVVVRVGPGRHDGAGELVVLGAGRSGDLDTEDAEPGVERLPVAAGPRWCRCPSTGS